MYLNLFSISGFIFPVKIGEIADVLFVLFFDMLAFLISFLSFKMIFRYYLHFYSTDLMGLFGMKFHLPIRKYYNLAAVGSSL